MLDIASAYYAAGLCPLPCICGYVGPSYIDGNGEVRCIDWGHYKIQRPDWPVVEEWFRRSTPVTAGMLLLAGSHVQPRAAHAAFLQIFDFETPETFEAYQEACAFAGYADILHRCVIERTPSGGAHLGFLCAAIEDKQKIALARKDDAEKQLLIELLQHQPCTVSPTSIHCKPEHPKGIAYTLVQGDWTQLHEISPAQRHVLIDIARSFNEVPEKVYSAPRERTGNARLPGDCLNERQTWTGGPTYLPSTAGRMSPGQDCDAGKGLSTSSDQGRSAGNPVPPMAPQAHTSMCSRPTPCPLRLTPPIPLSASMHCWSMRAISPQQPGH